MVAIKLLVLCSAVAVALGIDNGKNCLLSNSKCVTDAECKRHEDSKWNCVYGTCGCKSGYSQTSLTKCDSYKKYDADCKAAASEGKVCDPSGFLSCQSDKCKCINDKYERSGDVCKLKESEKKELDDTCAIDAQCVKGVPIGSATCQATKCKCDTPWTTKGKTCENQKHGESCKEGTDNQKCRRGLDNLECKSDKCECKTDYKYNSRVKLCIHKDSKLDRSEGETCDAAVIADNKKYEICKTNLECRKCATDTLSTGLCVDVKKLNPQTCSGSSQISVSVALLLTTVLAYLAY